VNGALSATGTTTPYSFSWNTASLANGSYTLTAKAYDAANNVTTSAPVTVTVNNPVTDITAPTVSITSPASESTGSGTTAVAVSASGSKGISKIELYVNGNLFATKKYLMSTKQVAANFKWSTSALPNGTCDLTAKAYDTAGQTAWSAVVTPIVNNAKVQIIGVRN